MIKRHIFKALAVVAFTVAIFPASAQNAAGSYPSKPIRIIVPYAAGTATDAIARQVGLVLSERLKQPVVLDNRAGANGAIGTGEGAKAAPDGYTLTLGVHGPLAMNPHLYRKLPYSPTDFVGVAGLIQGMYFLTATPSFPVNNLAELLVEAKKRPGEIDYGTYGVGSGSHLAGESLNMAAGIKLTAIHYKSSPITDLAGGVLKLSFDTYTVAGPFLKDKRAKALAVTSAKRHPAFPDIPAISEFVPNYEVTFWVALMAPKGTPAPIIELLNREVRMALETESVRTSITSTGSLPMVLTPAELDSKVLRDWAAAKKIVEAAKMSLD